MEIASRTTAFTSEVAVNAPPSAVWSVLENLSGWSAWNPVYTMASGSPKVGSWVTLTIVLPGSKPQKMRAKIMVVEPGRRLVFVGSVAGGLLTATRSFELAPLPEGRCLVRGSEVFAGLLAPVMVRLVGAKVQSAVALVNSALKRTVEDRATRD